MKRTVMAVLLASLALASACSSDTAAPIEPDAPPVTGAGSHAVPDPSVESSPGAPATVTDVEYKPGKYVTVVSPVADGLGPVVVILHGYGVQRQAYYGLANVLAQEGTVVFIPEWDCTLPTSEDRRTTTVTRGLDDIADAMRFARLNAWKHGGDSSRMVLVGHSLGGTFAMTTALAGDEFGTDAMPRSVSALPDACVSLDGVVPFRATLWTQELRQLYDEDPSTWDKIDPEHYLDASRVRSDVEFRYFVATLDYEACASMVERMRDLGCRASVSRIDVGHMEIAEPQTATVEAIRQLAHDQP